jgi:DNA-binding beta-propeller fold protein YncE
VEPFGQYLYLAAASNSVSTWIIDLRTGVPGQIASSSESGGPISLAVDPTDHFVYVANRSSNNVSGYAVGGNIGLLSLGTPFAAGSGPSWLAIDSSGDFVYVANIGSNSVSAYKIESGSLAAVTSSPFAAGTNPNSVAITALIKIRPTVVLTIDSFCLHRNGFRCLETNAPGIDSSRHRNTDVPRLRTSNKTETHGMP